MELYSRMPPHIPPKRFRNITLEIRDCAERSVEKTMPEKKSGQVRTTAVPSFPPVVEGKPPAWAIHQPTARLANRKRYARKGLVKPNLRTSPLPRKAMTRMLEIAIPITCQVFPNASPISVIALVSTSIKPAPRKKNGKCESSGFSLKKLANNTKDNRTISPSTTR